jgi:aryl carrier-like protein
LKPARPAAPDVRTIVGLLSNNVYISTKNLLSVEVVIDELRDVLQVHAVFVPEDMTVNDVDVLLSNFNRTVSSWVTNSSAGELRDTFSKSEANKVASHRPTVYKPVGSVTQNCADDYQKEAEVISIISELLSVQHTDVDPTISLLALGLDSIKAVAFSRLLRSVDLTLSAGDIMRNPSVRSITRVAATGQTVKTKKHTPRSPDTQAPNTISIPNAHPVTELQAGMLAKVCIMFSGTFVSYRFMLNQSRLLLPMGLSMCMHSLCTSSRSLT